MKPPRGERLAKVAFFFACLLLAFFCGFLVSHYRWWPHGFLERALAEAPGTMRGDSDLQHHVQPARYGFAGVKSYPAESGQTYVPSGCTLLTSFWEDRGGSPGLRLIDGAGRTLHHWDATPKRIWPVTPHTDAYAGPVAATFNYVHGCHLFANGDVLFNVEYMGLVRLDAAGNVIWRLDRRTHHSVTRDERGDFWVGSLRWVENEEQRRGRFPGLRMPFTEDIALRVSPAGEVLDEISVLDLVFASELRDRLWQQGGAPSLDILHMNDIEPLPSAIAAQYPRFAAGDLMVSLRSLSTVLVFDPKTRQVKWSASAPFLDQHDPDFIGDGWISVYSNHSEVAKDATHTGTSILYGIRPDRGEVRHLYPARESTPTERVFYSDKGGKAQLLAGGNWLVTESMGGRVFEVDARGRTVWEWAQARRADDKTISEVMEGTRYPYTRDEVAKWP